MQTGDHDASLTRMTSAGRAYSGRVWKYGDDVNTDVIFPGKYTYNVKEESEMAEHALEDLDPGFAGAVQPGDIIVAGRNWGCGSSREQAVVCLKAAGVRVIIARSFARIYFRNAINNGLLPVVCPEAVAAIEAGERSLWTWIAASCGARRESSRSRPCPIRRCASSRQAGCCPCCGKPMRPR